MRPVLSSDNYIYRNSFWIDVLDHSVFIKTDVIMMMIMTMVTW